MNLNFIHTERLGQQEKGNICFVVNLKRNFFFFNSFEVRVDDNVRDKDERVRANTTLKKKPKCVIDMTMNCHH